MKKLMQTPLTILSACSMMLFSCASSENTDAGYASESEALQEESGVIAGSDLADEEDITYYDMFEDVETENYDILTLAKMDENLSTFVNLVESSGLEASFSLAEPITVFIPTNEAFENISKERYAYLTDPQNRAELMQIIKAHILPNEVPTSRFNSTQVIETSAEKTLPLILQWTETSSPLGVPL